MFRYVGALFVAALLSYLLTPFAIMLAKKFNVYDIPRERRVHKVPTPLLGGLAISVSFLVTTLAFGLIDRSVFGLFAGGILILVVGIIDDVVELKPSVKLLGQIAAAGVGDVWHKGRVHNQSVHKADGLYRKLVHTDNDNMGGGVHQHSELHGRT